MIIPTKISDTLTTEQSTFLQALFAKSPESLSSCIMLKTYPKNHTLMSTDDPCANVYILLKGRLQAIEERVANEPYNFTELSAIEIVGDFELFTRLSNRDITLTTLEKTLCLVIPATDYLSWIRDDANALFIRTQMLIRQLVAQTQFERQNFFLDNKTRLLHFLYGECNKQHETPFQIKSTRQEISNKLGCSVRTIHRTILALRKEGLLNLQHGKIQITSAQYHLIQAYINQVFSNIVNSKPCVHYL